MHLLTCVGEVLTRREVCLAFEKAPRAPATGGSTVAVFNGKLQVGHLSLDDTIALHVAYALPEYSLLIPVRAENPQGVWGAFCNSRIGVFGPPSCVQMDEGGEWNHELWAELRSERQIESLSQGVRAHPWIFGRCNGLARGIYNRLKEGDRVWGT